MKNKAFLNHRRSGNGFRLTFPNGNSVSTIWGEMTYSDNHDVDFNSDYSIQMLGSDTCECMVTCTPEIHEVLEKEFEEEYDGVILMYLTLDKWLKLINILNK